MGINELKRHPYVNFYQARAIVDYSRLYGNLENLQQLRLDRDFTPEAIERLEPYVDFK
jgi:DNA uptake protein ComE-like DNA-binding protein